MTCMHVTRRFHTCSASQTQSTCAPTLHINVDATSSSAAADVIAASGSASHLGRSQSCSLSRDDWLYHEQVRSNNKALGRANREKDVALHMMDTASKAPSHKASSLPQHMKVASPSPTLLDARHQLAYERLKQALRMQLGDEESVKHVKQCAE